MKWKISLYTHGDLEYYKSLVASSKCQSSKCNVNVPAENKFGVKNAEPSSHPLAIELSDGLRLSRSISYLRSLGSFFSVNIIYSDKNTETTMKTLCGRV